MNLYKKYNITRLIVIWDYSEPGLKGLRKRATGPVLTSDKGEKHVIFPTTLNFALWRGDLWGYTLQNPPEVF